MGVYIKGMEMPTSCQSCFANEYQTCIFADENASVNGKLLDCPLVPVPPHGRLIDADELRWCYDNSDVADDVITKENYDQLKVAVAVVRQTIDDAPTIIEAEEEET